VAESDGQWRPETLLALADQELYRAKRDGEAPLAAVADVP
jgi:PleD family two-component response regulator